MVTMWSAAPTLNVVFDDVLRAALGGAERSQPHGLAADLHETETDYVFHFDVPGVKIEDLEITQMNGTLTVRGARNLEGGQTSARPSRRNYGFAASYALPEGIDVDALSADLEEGVLTVRLPKTPKAQPRKITVQVGAGVAR